MTVCFAHSGVGAYAHIQAGSGIEYSISSRPLCVSLPGDIVVIDAAIADEYLEVIRHYESMGLKVASRITADKSIIERMKRPHDSTDFYMQTVGNGKYSGKKSLSWCTSMNNKTSFLRTCAELGVPTPKTFFTDLSKRKKAGEMEVRFHFPHLAKSDVSSSGRGVFLISNPEEYEELLAKGVLKEHEHHLQEIIPDARSLNINLDSFNACWRWPSWQIIENFKYVGSESITPEENASLKKVYADAEKLRSYYSKQGYRGYLGFDVMITQDAHYFIECNPRWNTSLYFAKVAKKMGWEYWRSLRIKTVHNTFIGYPLRDQHPIFRQKNPPLIVNWGGIKNQVVDVVGTPEMFIDYI